MEGYVIVLLYWINTTSLARVQSDSIVSSKEVCEALLAHDLEARKRVHGNAQGYCLELPAKPADLPQGPPVFKKPGSADV